MLKRLHIENYLLIDSLDIETSDGLNIITGETGAGKSILLGAISMLLGAKNDGKASRNSYKKSVIEAHFDVRGYDLEDIFAENDVEYEEETIISRVTLPSGKSRAYINDLPVTLSTLKIVGERLVDIHSQHQTLLLSQENFQTSVVDAVAQNELLLDEYTKYFNELRRLKLRVKKLREDSAKNILDYDYIKYQYEELEGANITIGELERAEADFALLANASQIKECFLEANELIDGENGSVISTIKSVVNSFSKISNVLPLAASLEERLSTVLYELKDINEEVYNYVDNISDNPEQTVQLEERISKINKLLLKHNAKNEEDLITIREELEERLLNIDLSSTHIEQCEIEIATLQTKANKIAEKLTEKRNKAARIIEKQVVLQLSELGMESSNFMVNIENNFELNQYGENRIKFLFSANKGLSAEPIERVASGGEMSRVMLSLKSITAKYKKLPTIIFDEIDTGVSGKVADKMGEIMKKLSSSIQTICITHLPQVASKGEAHFMVSKSEKDDTTITKIEKLSDSERIEVIAKMISASSVTDAAREQAKLLLS
ncbi:MAG: DNA repair protein RecN [Rikenellaceae bacterium]